MEPVQAERLARRQIKKNARSCIDARAEALRQGASSWPEVLVAYELRKMGLDVHWQAPVRGWDWQNNGTNPLILDLWVPTLGLLIEIDGKSHIGSSRVRDRRRDTMLCFGGGAVIRVRNTWLTMDYKATIARLRVLVQTIKTARKKHGPACDLGWVGNPALGRPLDGPSPADPRLCVLVNGEAVGKLQGFTPTSSSSIDNVRLLDFNDNAELIKLETT